MILPSLTLLADEKGRLVIVAGEHTATFPALRSAVVEKWWPSVSTASVVEGREVP